MGERVGIFGGTFDPLHNGHLVAMAAAFDGAALDRMLVVPAGDPWQKAGAVAASAADRLAMVRAACAGRRGIEVSTIEIDRSGPTYTIDTVEALAATDRELFLVLGADAVGGLDTWKRADDLAAAVVVVAVNRNDVAVPAAPSSRWQVVPVTMARVDISSTQIRARAAAGLRLDGLVPDAVAHHIEAHDLYAVAS